MTRPEDEGGYRLVAVVSGAEDALVAEAGYAIMPDGNGEFGLTIAAGWRGSLGPYLLDALAAAAAVRGVPNLQADILLAHSPMLALVACRGCTTLDIMLNREDLSGGGAGRHRCGCEACPLRTPLTQLSSGR